MKVNELRDLSTAELEEKLADSKQELFNLRFQHAINQLDNPQRLSAVKKDIARVKTILREGVLYAYLRDAARIWGKKITKGAFKRCLRFFRWYLKHFHKKHFRYLLPIVPSLYPHRTPDPDVIENPLFARLAGEKNADALYLAAAERAAARMKEFLSAANGAPLPPAFSRHLLTGEKLETPCAHAEA